MKANIIIDKVKVIIGGFASNKKNVTPVKILESVYKYIRDDLLVRVQPRHLLENIILDYKDTLGSDLLRPMINSDEDKEGDYITTKPDPTLNLPIKYTKKNIERVCQNSVNKYPFNYPVSFNENNIYYCGAKYIFSGVFTYFSPFIRIVNEKLSTYDTRIRISLNGVDLYSKKFRSEDEEILIHNSNGFYLILDYLRLQNF